MARKISLNKIYSNPKNPRKPYHFDLESPAINDLIASLRQSGQRDPATVYELPDKPGEFMLLRGHRRHFCAVQADLDTLICNVVPYPESELAELVLLGSEEGNKEDWGEYTKLAFARDFANKSRIDITHRNVTAETGIPRTKLEHAKAMFSLHEDVVKHVELWEQWNYENKDSDRKKPAPFSEYHIKVTKFTPERAALIYKIFQTFRNHFNQTGDIADLSDLDLQIRIISNTRSATHKDLRNAINAMETCQPNPTLYQMNLIDRLVQKKSDGYAATTIANKLHNRYEEILVKAIKHTGITAKDLEILSVNCDKAGSNREYFLELKANLGSITKFSTRLEAQLDKRIRQLA